MWHLFCLGGAVRSDGDMYASRLVPLLIQSHALYPCDLCVVMLILLPIVLGGVLVSARLLLSNTSQYCWLICEVPLLPNCLYCWYLVTVQHLLMFRGAVSAKFRGQFYSVFHTNDSLAISESTSSGGVVSIKPWFNSHNLRGGDNCGVLSSHLLLVWYIEGLKSSEWRFNESS